MSGFFHGCERPLTAGQVKPVMGAESFINDATTDLLNEGKQVTVVDFGAQGAASLIALASLHEPEIEAGQARFIATNLEPDFSYPSLLLEARRRLAQFPNRNDWYRFLYSSGQPHSSYLQELVALREYEQPIFWDERTLDFLAANQHLVKFARASAYYLPKDLAAIGVPTLPDQSALDVYMVHENYGGIFYGGETTTNRLLQTIRPGGGVITTSKLLETQWRDRKLRLLLNPLLPLPNHDKYKVFDII